MVSFACGASIVVSIGVGKQFDSLSAKTKVDELSTEISGPLALVIDEVQLSGSLTTSVPSETRLFGDSESTPLTGVVGSSLINGSVRLTKYQCKHFIHTVWSVGRLNLR